MKGERWEKQVRKVRIAAATGMGYVVLGRTVVTLLRREHAAVVRAVKQLDKMEFKNMSSDFQAGQHNAYMRVLAALATRKGGG